MRRTDRAARDVVDGSIAFVRGLARPLASACLGVVLAACQRSGAKSEPAHDAGTTAPVASSPAHDAGSPAVVRCAVIGAW